METEDTIEKVDVPLSDEERATWEFIVGEGAKLRAPIIERRERRRAAIVEKARRKAEAEGKTFNPWWIGMKGKVVGPVEVPARCRRWVVARYSGLSFRRAFEASGATWLEVQAAKASSEDFRCAMAAMEENSRQLMKAKAQSIIEQSQDEGTKVSMAQTQVSMRILESLDRDNFGDGAGKAGSEGEVKSVGGGGFVINLIGDAAKAAVEAPKAKPGKALVFTDV